MWLLFAVGSSVFAGATAILAKMGLRRVDSTLATALRTVVVLAFAWLVVFITGAQAGMLGIGWQPYLFMGLSGLATGGSWLCYFRALQTGPVAGVAALDKSSTVLTILLAFVFLGEPFGPWQLAAMLLILAGTLLMVEWRAADAQNTGYSKSWPLYAILAAVFAALTALLGKVGVQGVDSNLATAVRTSVVLVAAWGMVLLRGGVGGVKAIGGQSWLFILLSGLATGLSWLCYYRALQTGPASVVVPVDKLSIVLTVVFASMVLKEKQDAKVWCGLALVVGGTLLMVFAT